MKQRISLIAAISENHVIGKDNKLVWSLPADWENFHKVTEGMPFIMGRKSFEAEDMLRSTGTNIVLSRQNEYSLPEGFIHFDNIPDAMDYFKDEPEVFILGGGDVFSQTYQMANYMFLTIVHDKYEGDTFFPEIDWKDWALTKTFRHEVDERHASPFSLNEYERIF